LAAEEATARCAGGGMNEAEDCEGVAAVIAQASLNGSGLVPGERTPRCVLLERMLDCVLASPTKLRVGMEGACKLALNLS